MILMYHHIGEKDNDENYMPEEKFLNDISLLKNKDLVYLSEYDPNDPNQVVITFDDAYTDILFFAVPLLSQYKIPFEVFVIEDYFRKAEAGNRHFLDKNGLLEAKSKGGRLQYHSKDHIDLSVLNDESEITLQIRPPKDLAALDLNGFEYFAYPFCKYNDLVIEITKKHFKGAVSGKGLGNNKNKYILDRVKVTPSNNLLDETATLF